MEFGGAIARDEEGIWDGYEKDRIYHHDVDKLGK